MKKYIGLVLLLLTSLLVISCGGKTETSASQAITAEPLAKGKTMLIRLESNPTTGFEWMYSLADGSGKGELTLTSEEYETSDTSGKLMGAGGYDVFSFEGAKKGPQTLTFIYKRNWEGGETAFEIMYDISIDDDMNILYYGKRKGTVENEKDISLFPDPIFQ